MRETCLQAATTHCNAATSRPSAISCSAACLGCLGEGVAYRSRDASGLRLDSSILLSWKSAAILS
jgi:hypothetical protein